MAGDIKLKYPASNADTAALTITLTGLATSSTLVAGREATAVDNRSNLDLDHLLSGKVRAGTSPTGGVIEVWAYAPISIASGTPAYPAGATGVDAALTVASVNQKNASFRRLWTARVDAVSDRDYFMPPTSIRRAFGDMPACWSIWLTHSSAVNLHATASNHAFHYERVQNQYT